VENYLMDNEVIGQVNDSFVSIPPNNFHLKIKGIIDEMTAQRYVSHSESALLADCEAGAL
jgi:hypothetical protein